MNGIYDSSFFNRFQGVGIDDRTHGTSFTSLVSDGAQMNASGSRPGKPMAGYKGNPRGFYAFGPVSSPTGSGWFIATHGSYGANAAISQNNTGLTPGLKSTVYGGRPGSPIRSHA